MRWRGREYGRTRASMPFEFFVNIVLRGLIVDRRIRSYLSLESRVVVLRVLCGRLSIDVCQKSAGVDLRSSVHTEHT